MAGSADDIARVLRWRAHTMPTRAAQALLICVLGFIATRDPLIFPWLVATLASAAVDAAVCGRALKRNQIHRFSPAICVSLFASSCVYSAGALVMLRAPGAMGVAEGGLILCAMILNTALMSRGEEPASALLTGPPGVTLVSLPLVARAFGHDIPITDLAPMLVGASFYVLFAGRIAKALSRERGMLRTVLAEQGSDREWLRQGVEAMNEGVALFDSDSRLLLWNSNFAGLAREDGLELEAGLRARAVLGELQPQAAATLAQAWRNKSSAVVQARHADGRWLNVEARTLANGGRIVVVADVTELKANEVSFRILFDDNPLPMLVIDATTFKVVNVNGAVAAGYGWAREQMLGRIITEFLPEAERALAHVRLTQIDRPNEPKPYTIHDGFGRTRDVMPFIRPSAYEGRPALLAAVLDMTERKQAMEAVEQARDAAEAANRAKSEFLATVSHEIRTPLNGVLGMAQAMARDTLPSRQRERLEVISQSGTALLAILNDILDLSKIEAGRLELEEVEFDLGELALGAHAAFTGLANAKGLSFNLEIAEPARGIWRGDSVRVRQVLYNLISNAVKFTETGEVRVRLERTEAGVRFIVRDTGVGVASDRLERLFDKFVQADSSTTRRYGGTGLGLAISAELCRAMGGTIQVASIEGEGSTFTVDLPLTRMADRSVAATALPDAGEHPPAIVEGGQVRVLAAEDNPVNQMVLKTLLAQMGMWPVIVENGAAAVEAWGAEPWDLILMDVQMPVMDGPGAARAIRAREAAEGRPRTPIIALTANAMTHQLESYRAAGMDGLVAKPINVAELFTAITAALEGACDEESRGAAAAG